jgi:EAL domain-containing protein (putative c-di-GMP-specific phosphodiesterase class I)
MRTQAGTKEEKVLAECFNHALRMVQHAQEQQFKNAMTDSLTGLMNRAGLKKQLDNEVQAEFLTMAEADFLQGWYFGSAQPLPSSLSAKAAVPTFASGSVAAVQQPA